VHLVGFHYHNICTVLWMSKCNMYVTKAWTVQKNYKWKEVSLNNWLHGKWHFTYSHKLLLFKKKKKKGKKKGCLRHWYLEITYISSLWGRFLVNFLIRMHSFFIIIMCTHSHSVIFMTNICNKFHILCATKMWYSEKKISYNECRKKIVSIFIYSCIIFIRMFETFLWCIIWCTSSL
jgi:hypothetical protein